MNVLGCKYMVTQYEYIFYLFLDIRDFYLFYLIIIISFSFSSPGLLLRENCVNLLNECECGIIEFDKLPYQLPKFAWSPRFVMSEDFWFLCRGIAQELVIWPVSLYLLIWGFFGILRQVTNIRTCIKSHGYWRML